MLPPTIFLGAGDARDLLGDAPTGCARLVLTSPAYFSAIDYTASARGERPDWYSGARLAFREYVAEQRAVVEALATVCAPDAVVAIEVDDFRDPAARTLVPLPDLWRDLLVGAGFRIVEHIRLARMVATGRRSGNFVRYGGAPGMYYPDSVSSSVIVAFRGDPQMRLRHDGGDAPRLDVAAMRPYLGNAWRVPVDAHRVAHPCQMHLSVAERLIALYSLPGDVVIDPFAGSGTSGLAAHRLGRSAILCEREPQFVELIRSRMSVTPLLRCANGVRVPSSQLWLPLSDAANAATAAAFSSFSPLDVPSARHRAIAAATSQVCGVALPPEIIALVERAERFYRYGPSGRPLRTA